MKEQSAEERTQSSLDIEHLLNNVVNKQVADYMDKFGDTIERKLGMTEDDLLNDMREQIWKGLLTHKKSGQANLKTYLNTIIKNRFLLLYNRSTLKKYNSVDYYAAPHGASGIDSEYTETEETGETLMEKRQEFMRNLVLLSNRDREVLKDLALGYGLDEMVERTGLSRVEVTSSINRIEEMARRRKIISE